MLITLLFGGLANLILGQVRRTYYVNYPFVGSHLVVLLLEGELHYKLMILAAFSYIQTNHLLNLVISCGD
jgi:hypothetical protein